MVGAVGGCAAVALGWALATAAPPPPSTPQQPGPWSVAVGPGHDDLGGCVTDPAVASALTAPVDPPVATTVALVPDAERADLDRVVACLRSRAGDVPVEVHAS
ncbi:hypothetical protein EBM89_10565 [Cellulomonas triticagri]|uniref:Uncharacterized protein n=1 Tax=Cellulomonas triticagri TaxID=2483352 RepID=A0A3M2J5M0_9CELL|nr:hypothetical protein EBM89_10565 [Cellulomonas triticagri]